MATNQKNEGKTRARRIRWRVLLLICIAASPFLGCLVYWSYWRLAESNFHTVVEGQVYRSAQPNPEEIRDWSRTYGLKSIVSLRGGRSKPFFPENAAAAKQAGVLLIVRRLSNSRLPTREEMRLLIETLECAPRPVLLHCREGVERTGVASLMAAMAVGGRDYQTARNQLSLRYLHVYHSRDRVEGVADRYEDYCRQQKTGTGGWKQFRAWALTTYAP